MCLVKQKYLTNYPYLIVGAAIPPFPNCIKISANVMTNGLWLKHWHFLVFVIDKKLRMKPLYLLLNQIKDCGTYCGLTGLMSACMSLLLLMSQKMLVDLKPSKPSCSAVPENPGSTPFTICTCFSFFSLVSWHSCQTQIWTSSLVSFSSLLPQTDFQTQVP